MKTFLDELKVKLPKTAARAASGSRSAAIKLFCLDCVGGIRKDVTNCTAKDCPLHPFRPYKNQGGL